MVFKQPEPWHSTLTRSGASAVATTFELIVPGFDLATTVKGLLYSAERSQEPAVNVCSVVHICLSTFTVCGCYRLVVSLALESSLEQ